MRVIAGRARGTQLRAPSGESVRPTGDRLRESLFAVLEPWLEGAAVLDLFAGSGALGIEAWSRGAATCVFVDRGRPALAALRENLRRCRAPGRVLARDWRAALAELSSEAARFDLVFLDPPYAFAGIAEVLESLAARGVLSPGALVAVERPVGECLPLPGDWERGRCIRAGGSAIFLCRPLRADTTGGAETARDDSLLK